MADVTGAGQIVTRLERDSGDRGNMLPQFANRGGPAAADVEHAAGDALGRRVTSEQVRVHHVGDKRKVARLRAITEDHRRFAAQRGGDEERYYGTVLRVEILARSEHVEIAQRDRLQPVRAPECLAVGFARQL